MSRTQDAGMRGICRVSTPVIGAVLIPLLAMSLCLSPECRSEEIRRLPDSVSAIPPQPSLERELIELVNRDRERLGFPRLEMDESLVRIARDHSRQMVAHAVLSHNLPPLGDLETRLDRAGYAHRVARENVARAFSVAQAETALALSPSHARNLLAVDVTHIGVGIVRGTAAADELYITQIFTTPAVHLAAASIQQSFEARVEELRRQGGLPPLPVDPMFRDVAACSIRKLDVPFSRDSLARLLAETKRELQRQGLGQASRLAIHVQSIRDVNDLQIPDQLREESARSFGTGVRETVDDRNQPITLVLSFIGLSE